MHTYPRPLQKGSVHKTVDSHRSFELRWLFLHKLKPYDMIKQSDKLEFVPLLSS